MPVNLQVVVFRIPGYGQTYLFGYCFSGRVLAAELLWQRLLMNCMQTLMPVMCRKQRNDYDILVTTDKLSEGVNLNRAGVVINYDIPWNPTCNSAAGTY